MARDGPTRCGRGDRAAGEGFVTRVGRGEHFRSASWLERSIRRLRGRGARTAPAVLRRAHELLLDAWPGDHLVSTLPGGERVRLSARYRQLSWNPEEYAAFRAAVTSGDTVLDVGANIGAYTLLFAQWVGRAGRVVAFEPTPAAVAGLRHQLRLNGLADRVDVVESAVADVVGTASFAADRVSGSNALIAAGRAGDHAITVRTTSLDAFCEAHGLRPQVIKIDVEGTEMEVLRGARRTLSVPGVQTFLELHPAAWPSLGVTPALIQAELASQGLAPEPLDPSIDIWNTEGIAVRLRRVQSGH
jgi:FkbM family methyltransferase